MIKVSNLDFSFLAKETESPVFRNLSFEITTGRNICILGPSGSGKTTLMKLIAGELTPQRGNIELDSDLAPYFSPLETMLLPFRNVKENALLAVELSNHLEVQHNKLVDQYLSQFSLASVADKLPSELSYGMKKRVGIIQTIMRDSELILLDEPFSGLDITTRREIEDVIYDFTTSQYKNKNQLKNLVFVTHNIETAIALSDTVLVISGAPWNRLVEVNLSNFYSLYESPPKNRRKSKEFIELILNVQNKLQKVTSDSDEFK